MIFCRAVPSRIAPSEHLATSCGHGQQGVRACGRNCTCEPRVYAPVHAKECLAPVDTDTASLMPCTAVKVVRGPVSSLPTPSCPNELSPVAYNAPDAVLRQQSRDNSERRMWKCASTCTYRPGQWCAMC